MYKRIVSLLLSLALLSLACLQTALMVESVPAEAVPTGTATEIDSGAVWIAPSVVPSTASEFVCAVVVAVRSLHLRSEPDFNSESLVFMRSGEDVQLLDDSNPDWWKVRRGDLIGYARSKYLLLVECE